MAWSCVAPFGLGGARALTCAPLLWGRAVVRSRDKKEGTGDKERRKLGLVLRFGAIAVVCLVWGACGEPAGPYETAGIELHSSGGDEVVSEEGGGFGTEIGPGLAAPAGTRDEFQEFLRKAKERRERELAEVDPQSPVHRRLRAEILAIERKLGNLDLAFLQQRNAFVLAQGNIDNFVYQYAPDRQWEATYAMRAGDMGLAASIVQDVLRPLRDSRGQASGPRPTSQKTRPRSTRRSTRTSATWRRTG